MSCERSHRSVVSTVLTLAGIDNIHADEVIRVGQALRRRTRGEPTTGTESGLRLFYDNIRTIFGVTGHTDHVVPAWIHQMFMILHHARRNGNRNAFLTMQFLTGGIDAVTSHLSPDDGQWVARFHTMSLTVPPAAWYDQTFINYRVQEIGRLLPYGTNAIAVKDILDSFGDTTTVTPNQPITPMHIVRFLFGKPYRSAPDLQHVLRAVLERAPVVRETITNLYAFCRSSWEAFSALPIRLYNWIDVGGERNLETTLLEDVATWMRKAGGTVGDPIALLDPPPHIVDELTSLLRDHWRGCYTFFNEASSSLTTLFHLWQKRGHHAAVVQSIQSVEHVLRNTVPEQANTIVREIANLIITEIVPPPYGDTIIPHLSIATNQHTAWYAFTAAAVYARACQQIGYVPTNDDLRERMLIQWRDSWIKRWYDTAPSPAPLLTVGNEQILHSLLHTIDEPGQLIRVLRDCIDAMDMLDVIGGNPRALQEVIAAFLIENRDARFPEIVFRLAASRCGQAILTQCADVPSLPAWNDVLFDSMDSDPYLLSPWWDTAPSHLSTWQQDAITRVTASPVHSFRYLLPFYPSIVPEVAIRCPEPQLVTRAVTHWRWSTFPKETRRACLRDALNMANNKRASILAMAAHVISATGPDDMMAALNESNLSESDKSTLRHLLDLDTEGTV